jgi:hypothetical protein
MLVGGGLTLSGCNEGAVEPVPEAPGVVRGSDEDGVIAPPEFVPGGSARGKLPSID